MRPRRNALIVPKLQSGGRCEDPKPAPTKRTPRPSKVGITKQYLDLQELREEVRRAEMRFGRMRSAKGATRPEQRSH